MKTFGILMCLICSLAGFARSEVLGLLKIGGSVIVAEGNKQACCEKMIFSVFGEKGSIPRKEYLAKDGEITADKVIKNADFSDKKLFKRTLKIITAEGTYFVPMPGSTFLVNPPRVYFETKDRKLKKIGLPMSGGEIKGVEALNGGLKLFVYDRATSQRVKGGRQLYVISRTGKNYMISVSSGGAVSAEDAGAGNDSVFWAEGGEFITIDNKTLALMKHSAK